jgi:hypothetical protein
MWVSRFWISVFSRKRSSSRACPERMAAISPAGSWSAAARLRAAERATASFSRRTDRSPRLSF